MTLTTLTILYTELPSLAVLEVINAKVGDDLDFKGLFLPVFFDLQGVMLGKLALTAIVDGQDELVRGVLCRCFWGLSANYFRTG